jgi:hypothetical protein
VFTCCFCLCRKQVERLAAQRARQPNVAPGFLPSPHPRSDWFDKLTWPKRLCRQDHALAFGVERDDRARSGVLEADFVAQLAQVSRKFPPSYLIKTFQKPKQIPECPLKSIAGLGAGCKNKQLLLQPSCPICINSQRKFADFPISATMQADCWANR